MSVVNYKQAITANLQSSFSRRTYNLTCEVLLAKLKGNVALPSLWQASLFLHTNRTSNTIPAN
jgi:hypothetical protein